MSTDHDTSPERLAADALAEIALHLEALAESSRRVESILAEIRDGRRGDA